MFNQQSRIRVIVNDLSSKMKSFYVQSVVKDKLFTAEHGAKHISGLFVCLFLVFFCFVFCFFGTNEDI